MTTPIYLEVKPHAGSDITDAAKLMQSMADLLKINVCCPDWNGVRLMAYPGGEPAVLVAQFFKAVVLPKNEFKHAGTLSR